MPGRRWPALAVSDRWLSVSPTKPGAVQRAGGSLEIPLLQHQFQGLGDVRGVRAPGDAFCRVAVAEKRVGQLESTCLCCRDG